MMASASRRRTSCQAQAVVLSCTAPQPEQYPQPLTMQMLSARKAPQTHCCASLLMPCKPRAMSTDNAEVDRCSQVMPKMLAINTIAMQAAHAVGRSSWRG